MLGIGKRHPFLSLPFPHRYLPSLISPSLSHPPSIAIFTLSLHPLSLLSPTLFPSLYPLSLLSHLSISSSLPLSPTLASPLPNFSLISPTLSPSLSLFLSHLSLSSSFPPFPILFPSPPPLLSHFSLSLYFPSFLCHYPLSVSHLPLLFPSYFSRLPVSPLFLFGARCPSLFFSPSLVVYGHEREGKSGREGRKLGGRAALRSLAVITSIP